MFWQVSKFQERFGKTVYGIFFSDPSTCLPRDDGCSDMTCLFIDSYNI